MCFFLAPAWGSFNPHASNASSVPPTCQRRVSGQICETHRLSRSASSSHYSPKLRLTMQARDSSTHERASCVTQLGRLTPKGKSSLITAMISLSSQTERSPPWLNLPGPLARQPRCTTPLAVGSRTGLSDWQRPDSAAPQILHSRAAPPSPSHHRPTALRPHLAETGTITFANAMLWYKLDNNLI